MQTTEENGAAAPVMTGARILIEALHAEGVEYVFGYPGGAVLPIYDEIYKQKYFKHVLVRFTPPMPIRVARTRSA